MKGICLSSRIKSLLVVACLLAAMMVYSCDYIPADKPGSIGGAHEISEIDMPDTLPPLAAAPVVIPNIPVPVASGIAVAENAKAIIDFSNIRDGYIMAAFHEDDSNQIRLVIVKPGGVSYTFRLNPGEGFHVFPLSLGDGEYNVGIWEQVDGDMYRRVLAESFYVQLSDEFAPFLRPNELVDFDQDSLVVITAAEQTAGLESQIDKIDAIYYYLIDNMIYDDDLAEAVQTDLTYIPDITAVLERGMGICFDFAAVMTAMLRSQGIPTKMVVGQRGDEPHAWVSVYTEESGMVNDLFFFEGGIWVNIDPTAAASGNERPEVNEFIGDWADYHAHFFY